MLGVQAFGPLLPAMPLGQPGTLSGAETVGATRPDDGSGDPGSGSGSRRSEREAWVVLLSVPGLGPVAFTTLLAAFGSAGRVLDAATLPNARTVFHEAVHDLRGPDGTKSRLLPEQLAERIGRHVETGEEVVRRVASLGLAIVTLDDEAYPVRLRAIEMPPPLLFVRGNPAALSPRRAVAVVGTRCPSDRGRRVAGWIAAAVGRAGATIVSGLAVGIDGAAHAAAVAEGRPTVAVLGGGHARLFPRAHERLAEAIADDGGAVVSELPPDTIPTKGTFPRRNRVISGLSDATVVVEAGARSGALITAGWALEQGRECYLVPGAIDAPQSVGCNAFLRAFAEQARIVVGVPELLEDLRLTVGDGGDAAVWADAAGADASGSVDDEADATAATAQPSSAPRPNRADAPHAAAAAAARRASPDAVIAALAPVERLVAEAVAGGACTADRLVAATALSGATVLSVLTLLELQGLVSSAYGRYRPAGILAAWNPGVPGSARVALPPRPSAGQGSTGSSAG